MQTVKNVYKGHVRGTAAPTHVRIYWVGNWKGREGEESGRNKVCLGRCVRGYCAKGETKRKNFQSPPGKRRSKRGGAGVRRVACLWGGGGGRRSQTRERQSKKRTLGNGHRAVQVRQRFERAGPEANWENRNKVV